MKRPQISVRTLLWLMLVLALALSWLLDRQRLVARIEQGEQEQAESATKIAQYRLGQEALVDKLNALQRGEEEWNKIREVLYPREKRSKSTAAPAQ